MYVQILYWLTVLIPGHILFSWTISGMETTVQINSKDKGKNGENKMRNIVKYIYMT